VAHFRHLEIVRELDAFPYNEYAIKPSHALDEKIVSAIKKSRQKAAFQKQRVALSKMAAAAVIIILCIAATPTVLFAVSADFRETVYYYIIDWREGHTNINIEGLIEETAFLKYYVPAYIPEGFVLEEYTDIETLFELYYSNGEQYLYFSTSPITTGRMLDNETATFDFGYKINDIPAIIRENRGKVTIIWQDGASAFELTTNLPLATALDVAVSYRLQEGF
jgi:hypothetical protein